MGKQIHLMSSQQVTLPPRSIREVMTFPDIQIPQLPYIITEGLYQDEDPEEEDFKIISMLCNQRGKEYPLICNNEAQGHSTPRNILRPETFYAMKQ